MKAGKHPCMECPFRRQSPRGWLGPWQSAQEILDQAFSEAGLACHMTVKQTGVVEGTTVCVGALVCANKSAKSYRDHDLHLLQKNAKPDDGVLDAWEFRDHHKNRIGTVGGKGNV